MNNYPKYAEVNGRRYKINTDFRYALKCNQIAEDETIGDTERALGIICVLFGENALNVPNDYEKLLKIAQKYLACGKKIENTGEKPDMDFIEDYSYIRTSFRSDYGIKLDDEKIHWWEFMDLINGLSNSEMGNCCVLNRVRAIRNYDTKDIKDAKERQKINKMKKQFELKKYSKTPQHTEKQKEEVKELLSRIKIRKE